MPRDSGRVRIEPSLGDLRRVSGAVPHPAGKIGVDYEADGRGGLRARIDLPEGVAGDICLAGKGVFVERGPAGDDGPVTV